jgi:Uncharacterized conserved protein
MRTVTSFMIKTLLMCKSSAFLLLPRDRQVQSTISSLVLPRPPRRRFSLSSSSQQQHQEQLQKTLKELQDGEYYQSEEVIKKSRFIGIAKHCTSWENAQQFFEFIRSQHPKSRHVCFAYVGGFNPKTERCSDDGEPTGTAGVPILGAINGEDISDTICVVVRYYGGIKLGAGGLIRAYGGAARLVLREAEKEVLIPKLSLQLSTTSSNAGQIYSIAAKYNGIVEGESYSDQGDLQVTITCNVDQFETMQQDLVDATRGNITFL